MRILSYWVARFEHLDREEGFRTSSDVRVEEPTLEALRKAQTLPRSARNVQFLYITEHALVVDLWLFSLVFILCKTEMNPAETQQLA